MPNLAAVDTTGVNYTRTSTSKPSDSFPGLMALVTGGIARAMGTFYDVEYGPVANNWHYDLCWQKKFSCIKNYDPPLLSHRIRVSNPLRLDSI